MTTEMEIETGLALLFEERSEDPCEHTQHEAMPMLHDGPGEWLTLSTHRTCGYSRHQLVCDKFYRWLTTGAGLIFCRKCGERNLKALEIFTVLGRKGVDF